jgi:ApaG protein
MSQPQFTCQAKVEHLPDRSDETHHAYAYTITIKNTGDITAQLVARHWVITDAEGVVQEVRGLAVVGYQPVLKPGESFEYASWATIATPHGTMQGTFYCMTDDAYPFDATVSFTLARAQALH